MSKETIFVVLITTLTIFVPLIVSSLGGLFSEKSGVINIGIEGMMIFGAFIGSIIVPAIADSLPWFLTVIIGLLAAMIGALLMGALHAFLSINLGVNQIISGTVINMLAPAIAFLYFQVNYGTSDSERIVLNSGLLSLGIGATISYVKIFVIVLAILVLFAVIWFFNKTRFGRYITACGQNPQAAATAGLNVNRIRFSSVLISAALAGFGGMSMLFVVDSRLTPNLITGYGFLALAILIFSGWSAIKCAFGSLLFAFFIAIEPVISRLAQSEAIANPLFVQILSLLVKVGPYIIAIVILIIFSQNSRSPKALGQVYDKEAR